MRLILQAGHRALALSISTNPSVFTVLSCGQGKAAIVDTLKLYSAAGSSDFPQDSFPTDFSFTEA